ncbi:hypothetical protein PENNAL_c0306G09678, partial [Penicillium nalgiovense]
RLEISDPTKNTIKTGRVLLVNVIYIITILFVYVTIVVRILREGAYYTKEAAADYDSNIAV